MKELFILILLLGLLFVSARISAAQSAADTGSNSTQDLEGVEPLVVVQTWSVEHFTAKLAQTQFFAINELETARTPQGERIPSLHQNPSALAAWAPGFAGLS